MTNCLELAVINDWVVLFIPSGDINVLRSQDIAVSIPLSCLKKNWSLFIFIDFGNTGNIERNFGAGTEGGASGYADRYKFTSCMLMCHSYISR